jgi:hypothetical protein
MKANLAGVIGLGMLIGWGIAHAQSDEQPVPKAPYLTPVPDYGHWMVTFKYAPSAPAPTPAGAPPAAPAAPEPPTGQDGPPKSIETIKTGELRGITVTAFDGSTREFTCQGNWVLSSSPHGAQLGIITPVSHPYTFFTTGYILLDKAKIDPSTYKGVEKRNGIQAFHYKSADLDVWIEFLTPPPRPFPIPKDQQELLEKEQAAYKATSSMR